MAKPRVTATDRLANVIEVVELGQRTGLLAVERGSGSVLEEGELYFSNGHVIHASLAGLRGREALAALGRWGPCRFSFDANAPRPAPNMQAGDSDPRGRRGGQSQALTPPQTGESSGIWPSYGIQPESGPLNGSGWPSSAANSGSFSYPTPPQPASSGSLDPSPSGTFLMRRPRRAPDVRNLMQMVTAHNLSRNHRTLLLLADGEHTILDLARLSSKSVDEVSALLADLESRQLIYYYER